MESIKVEVARMRKLDDNGALKAFVDVVIGDAFVVKGMRIINGKNGLFVGMPREQGRDGKWYPSVFPITKEVKESLEETLLGAYGLP